MWFKVNLQSESQCFRTIALFSSQVLCISVFMSQFTSETQILNIIFAQWSEVIYVRNNLEIYLHIKSRYYKVKQVPRQHDKCPFPLWLTLKSTSCNELSHIWQHAAHMCNVPLLKGVEAGCFQCSALFGWPSRSCKNYWAKNSKDLTKWDDLRRNGLEGGAAAFLF